MAKTALPKGFMAIDKFNGKFTLNGGQFEFSKPVKLHSESKGVVDGLIYRYPVAPKKLYFTTLVGENMDDVNGFSFAQEQSDINN